MINMPSFLDAKNLQTFVSNELREVINPITYLSKRGATQQYYLCYVIFISKSDKPMSLLKKQKPLAGEYKNYT